MEKKVDFMKSGKPVVHGRSTSYVTHGCRCEPCRKAAIAYLKKYKKPGRKENQRSPDDQRVDFTPSGKPVTHGTRATYNRGCRCELCREENSRSGREQQERRDRRVREGTAEFEHGTETGYFNWRCRCEPCRAAGARKNKRDEEARKAGYVREFRKPDVMQRSQEKRVAEFKAGTRSITHGTVRGYSAYGCRCEPCKKSASEYAKKRRERKKAEQ